MPNPTHLVLRDASGLDFSATKWDEGRPSSVLLVHGLLGSRSMREIVRVAEGLLDTYDVMAIDVRGHGESPGRFTWGREEWSQVAAAVAHLAPRKVFGVGFSYGGYHIARAIARGTPIERIVLVGSPVDLRVLDHFPFGPKLWRHAPAAFARGRRRMRVEWFPPGKEAALPDEELRAVKVPALVVHGESDWLISARHADRYMATLPAAKRLDVPRGLHGEYLVTSHGDLLVEAIRSFLDGRM
ncbi:MAG TPA: alpha/beta hydrolase [Candidatus Polarisedimenticolaceae bacterium]|nr:alpha/beta hydrolase [Candidatus Polarisedimenticolaceae bacterium]